MPEAPNQNCNNCTQPLALHSTMHVIQHCGIRIADMSRQLGQSLLLLLCSDSAGISASEVPSIDFRHEDQPLSPSLFDILLSIPTLFDTLDSATAQAVSATCTELHRCFQRRTILISLGHPSDMERLSIKQWPRLVMIIISTPSGHVFHKQNLGRSKGEEPVTTLPSDWTSLAYVHMSDNCSEPGQWNSRWKVGILVVPSLVVTLPCLQGYVLHLSSV